MTFVTVGNATQGFRRLLDAVERAAKAHLLPLPLVIQSGNNSTFVSHCGDVRPFMEMDEFEHHIARARLVIGHGGAGTVIHALAAGQRPVVMPRRRVCGEHIDDHQVEFVTELAQRGRVIPAWEAVDVPRAVAEALTATPAGAETIGDRMLSLVAASLRELLTPVGEGTA